MSIEEICSKRGITDLLHFTQLSNLKSILKNGLLTRDYLDQYNILYQYNDNMRIDGFKNSISFSISFPNYKMFYRLRQKKTCNWIVLLCDAEILKKFDCIFCYTNAADTRILLEDHKRLKLDTALEQMFSETYEKREGLDDNDTTDIQAEVLCLNNISRDYINTIFFDNEEEMVKFNLLQTDINTTYWEPGQGIFASREYFKEWCRRNGL